MASILFQILAVLAVVSLLAFIERGDSAIRRMRAVEVRSKRHRKHR